MDELLKALAGLVPYVKVYLAIVICVSFLGFAIVVAWFLSMGRKL
jgi:hypothetical protein